MMTQGQYADLLDGAVIPVTSACPSCGLRGQVTVRKILRAKPVGSFSLAGVQMKFSAYEDLEAACGACGASGPAAPKAAAQDSEGEQDR